MINIQDNFLYSTDFNNISQLFQKPDVPWSYNQTITNPLPNPEDDIDNYQFVHVFWNASRFHPPSPYMQSLDPILAKLPPWHVILRLKLNLNPRTPKPFYSAWHVDSQLDNTTSIFYLNTNNGGTQLRNGMFIQSVANRLVSFPSNLEHRGVSCTDERARLVLNINYIKNPKKEWHGIGGGV